MPFQYTLANLLADNDGAIAVLFVDETGETVDLATAQFTHYDMKVLGAYIGIYLRHMTDLLERLDVGRPRLLHIERESVHLYAVPLPEGYFLGLVQDRPSLTARSRASLERARAEIAREIFGEE